MTTLPIFNLPGCRKIAHGHLAGLCVDADEPRKDIVEEAVRAVGGLVYRRGRRNQWMATLGYEGWRRQWRVIEEMERVALGMKWAGMEALSAGLPLESHELYCAMLDAVGGSSLGAHIRSTIAERVMIAMMLHPEIDFDDVYDVFQLVRGW